MKTINAELVEKASRRRISLELHSENERLQGEVERLSRLVGEHHAAGAMAQAKPGDDCPVCLKHGGPRPESLSDWLQRTNERLGVELDELAGENVMLGAALKDAFKLIESPLGTPDFLRNEIGHIERQYGPDSEEARRYRASLDGLIAKAERKIETYLRIKALVERHEAE